MCECVKNTFSMPPTAPSRVVAQPSPQSIKIRSGFQSNQLEYSAREKPRRESLGAGMSSRRQFAKSRVQVAKGGFDRALQFWLEETVLFWLVLNDWKWAQALPQCNPVRCASNRDHDFAEVRARLHVVIRLARLLERKHPIHDRLNARRVQKAREFLERLDRADVNPAHRRVF